MSVSHDILWFRVWQHIYVVVLYVFLGLDFGILTIFFEKLNFDLYAFNFMYIFFKTKIVFKFNELFVSI